MPRTKSILRLLTLAQLLAFVVDQQSLEAQVRAAAGITIEGESMVGSAQVTHGKLAPQNMQPFGAGWSGGSQLFWAGAQPGAELRLSFPIGAAGRYEIFLHFTRAPDYAVVRASFDGAPWVTFNGYAPTVTRARALVAMRDLTPGTHELLLKVTSKDGPSQGLNVGIDRIELAPVSAPVPPSPSENRPVLRNPGGSMTQAAGASVVGGGTPPVPVLHIPPASSPPQQMMTQGIEPLSTSARISVMQQATSLPLTGGPGQPLRLSASQSRVLNKAYLHLKGGALSSDKSSEGWIGLPPNARLTISYNQVEPKQPHLLDCGIKLDAAGDVKLSGITGQTMQAGPELYKVSLPQGDQRLLAVLVPALPNFEIGIEPVGSTFFVLRYCELTPFK